jgi:predicted phage tail protein
MGKLGKLAGTSAVEVVANSVAEAVQAAQNIVPFFSKFSRENPLWVRIEGYVSKGAIFHYCDKDEIKVYYIPTPQGSKSQVVQIIIGVILIVASFFVPELLAFAGYTLSATTVATIGTTLFSIGLTLTMGGVMALLAPTPESDTGTEGSRFNGYSMTTKNGTPIPILYGTEQLPGHLLSSDVKPKKFFNLVKV